MTTPKQNKDLIGKGLRSLLKNIDEDLKTTAGTLKNEVVEKQLPQPELILRIFKSTRNNHAEILMNMH